MTKLFTAAEIATMHLPDLPSTKRAIQLRAEKEEWHYETRVGLGGVRKVFAIPARYLAAQNEVTTGHLVGEQRHAGPDLSSPDKEATKEADSPRATAPQDKVIGTVVAGSAQGDMDRIQLVVRAVSEWEAERGVKISEDRRPAVIAVLYDYVKKAEESGEGQVGIERFLKALG